MKLDILASEKTENVEERARMGRRKKFENRIFNAIYENHEWNENGKRKRPFFGVGGVTFGTVPYCTVHTSYNTSLRVL